jgi:predicted RecA/RadA family phage recombinase
MKNQFAQGDALDLVAPGGGVVSGNGYQFGASLFGIASTTAAAGVVVSFYLVGVYTLPKLSTDAWAVGDLLYWDNTNHWLTKTVGTNLLVGKAVIANLATSTTGTCRLSPG